MLTSNPREVVDLLKGNRLIHRTGIWLMPVNMLGKEPNHAARLNLDAVDIRATLLESLPEDTRFLDLSGDKVVQLLDHICEHDKGSSCLLVSNVDLLLARLRLQERVYVWGQLYNAFPHRKRALVIVMPEGADHLLPGLAALKSWNSDKRLAATNPIDV
jgi:hypothetical protein